MEIYLQEHNELIQGIILKNRHLKDIIGKRQTLDNYDPPLFFMLVGHFFYCYPGIEHFIYLKKSGNCTLLLSSGESIQWVFPLILR
jgi:hypothetical protein